MVEARRMDAKVERIRLEDLGQTLGIQITCKRKVISERQNESVVNGVPQKLWDENLSSNEKQEKEKQQEEE